MEERGDLGEVLDEASIEICEAEKGLDVMDSFSVQASSECL